MRRTAAEAAETRQRVLDAALLSFAEHGWNGATFERIATRAGLTRGAVHHHFRAGKHELLQVLLLEQWQHYSEVVQAPLADPALGPGEQLRRFLTSYMELLVVEEMFRALATVTALIAPVAAAEEGDREQHRRSLDVWRAALRTVLERPAVLRAGIAIETAVFVLVNFVVGVNATAALEPALLPRTAAERTAVAAAVAAALIEEGR